MPLNVYVRASHMLTKRVLHLAGHFKDESSMRQSSALVLIANSDSVSGSSVVTNNILYA